MNLAKLAISRPYTVAVGFLVAILIGAFSLTRLPIDLMPDITYPTLTVSTDYAGVGPEEIETLITRPVEEAVSAVQGIEEVTSVSVEGRSQVRLSFHWGTDLDVAMDDVRARLDRIRARLPEDASPPSVYKFDIAAFPVVFLGVSGHLPPLELKRVAEDEIKYRLERIPGVAAAEVRGGLDREIRVEVDRQKLTALGLTLEQVSAALGRENLNVAAGEFRQAQTEFGLRVAGEFVDVAEISDATVATRAGQPILVRDVAKVVDTHRDVTSVVTIDGVSSLQVVIRKQSGGNTVQVAESVVKEIDAINADLRGASVSVINDTSRFIRRSIEHLQNDMLVGGILAAGVLLFFLRNIRTTLIVTTAIPISVIATFALLYFQDFSLNTLSLGGLALGLGRLVDDSIVVIENIHRHRSMGKNPAAAALDGTREVSLAIVASTVTTVAVFVPLIFLTGMTGVMFRQLSLVVVFSLACSLVVAQGLIPLLAARILKEDARPRRFTGIYDGIGRFLDGLDVLYRRSLDWALTRSRRVLAGTAIAVVGSLALAPQIGTEFMPSSDEGEVRINAEMAAGTPLPVMEERFRILEGIARREVPEAELMLAEVGGGGWRASGGNSGSLRLILTPATERKRSSEQIANELRRHVSGIAGLTTRVSAGGGLRIMRMGQADGSKLGVQVRGFDMATANRLSDAVKAAMEGTAGIADVRVSRESGRPETVVRLDRAKAASLGISVTQAARALETAVLGRRATQFRIDGDEYPVVVRLPESQRQSLDDVLDVAVATAGGQLVALREIVKAQPGEGPSTIERENQERVVNVSGELVAQDLGSTVSQLREKLQAISVPSGFSLMVTGDFEEQQKAFNELATALGLAVLLVFLVMVAQFESLRAPFVILLTVPTCVTGVVLALWSTGTTMNVQSFIGLIVLVGVAVSNGIVMVDFMNQLQEEGKPMEEVVRDGAHTRLRPVLMTTATTVLAMVPMGLGLGEGAELQAPMARVIIGGLLSSTFITLYLVPIVYRRLGKRRHGAQELGQVHP